MSCEADRNLNVVYPIRGPASVASGNGPRPFLRTEIDGPNLVFSWSMDGAGWTRAGLHPGHAISLGRIWRRQPDPVHGHVYRAVLQRSCPASRRHADFDFLQAQERASRDPRLAVSRGALIHVALSRRGSAMSRPSLSVSGACPLGFCPVFSSGVAAAPARPVTRKIRRRPPAVVTPPSSSAPRRTGQCQYRQPDADRCAQRADYPRRSHYAGLERRV